MGHLCNVKLVPYQIAEWKILRRWQDILKNQMLTHFTKGFFIYLLFLCFFFFEMEKEREKEGEGGREWLVWPCVSAFSLSSAQTSEPLQLPSWPPGDSVIIVPETVVRTRDGCVIAVWHTFPGEGCRLAVCLFYFSEHGQVGLQTTVDHYLKVLAFKNRDGERKAFYP